MHHQQPMHRAGEADLATAPAHRLGNRHGRQRFVDDIADQGVQGAARRDAAKDEPGALVGMQTFQLVDRYSTGSGEPQHRLTRLTMSVKGLTDGRTPALGFLLGLTRRNPRDQRGQTSRRIQHARLTMLDTAAIKPGDDTVDKGLCQAGQGLDRQFFGTQFDQQGLVQQ